MEVAHITTLPREVLDIILGYIDEDEKPSNRQILLEQPTLNSVLSNKYKHPPLKSLSRTCKILRRVLVPLIFKHAIHLVTSDARNAARVAKKFSMWPDKYWEFTHLVESLHLRNIVRTFTLAIKEQAQLDYKDSCVPNTEEEDEIERRWFYLLHIVCPYVFRITIAAPPTIVSSLVGLQLHPRAARSLHMPYHILCLRKTEITLSHSPARSRSNSSRTGTSSPRQTLDDLDSRRSLLELASWTGMLYNEGSFLRTLAAHYVPADSFWYEHLAFSQPFIDKAAKQSMMPELREFVYIGLSAPRQRLTSLTHFVATLPKLESFSFRLQSAQTPLPDPEYWWGRVSQHHIANILQDSCPKLMYIMKEKYQIANYLGLGSCFDQLNRVECLNTADEVSFDDDEEDLPPGWSWEMYPSNVLIRDDDTDAAEDESEMDID